VKRAAHTARWTGLLLVASLVAGPPLQNRSYPSRPNFQEQALATWGTFFRALLTQQAKTPFPSRFLNRSRQAKPPTAEEAWKYARWLHGKDFVQSYYIIKDLREIYAYAKLMNFPVLILLEEIKKLPRESENYQLTVTALKTNYNLTNYERIENLYSEIKDPEKKGDLLAILRSIQYKTLILHTEGIMPVNRRTWFNRYQPMNELLLALVRELLQSHPQIVIRDEAVSEAIETKNLYNQLSHQGLMHQIKISAYDKMIDFSYGQDPISGRKHVFNSENELIQTIEPDGTLWVRWTLASVYLPAHKRWPILFLFKVFGNVLFGERYLPQYEPASIINKKTISLINLEAQAISQKHPDQLTFERGDIFSPPSTVETYHIVRIAGLLMRTENYFNDSAIKEVLIQYGRDPHFAEGGYLLNGIFGTKNNQNQLFLDVYRKENGKLIRIPEYSKGYTNSEGWEVIDLSEKGTFLSNGVTALKRAA
jgi:hypothetical protein